MIVLLMSLLAYPFSPADSCWKLVTLGDVPERALLFAELATGEGGQCVLDMGRLLEIAGRFQDAAMYYGTISTPACEPEVIRWLGNRRAGSTLLDTVLVLETFVTNNGLNPVVDLTLIVPVPVSHAPYQTVEIIGGEYSRDGDLLSLAIDTLAPSETHTASVRLRIRQEPYTFRPIPDPLAGASLRSISELMDSIPVPEEYSGSGPCFNMSLMLRDRATDLDLSLSIVGGLVRSGDSLIFHAWNLLDEDLPGLPLDPLFFRTDTLFALGHCPTDVIPLWDLLSTDGSELVVLYPSQKADLEIGMSAVFAN
jgi:hypothetical protein